MPEIAPQTIGPVPTQIPASDTLTRTTGNAPVGISATQINPAAAPPPQSHEELVAAANAGDAFQRSTPVA